MEIKKFEEFLNEEIFRQDNKVKKYEKLLIDAVINFLKEKWNFDAKIIVKKKRNDSLIGDISLSSASVNNHKFTLHFNPNRSYLGIVRSLIHELTHVKQVVKGELKPGPNWKSIIWKDDYKITVREYRKIKDFETYKNLPWEKEAYENMDDKSLRNELFNSKYWKNLKGKDKKLDYILDYSNLS